MRVSDFLRLNSIFCLAVTSYFLRVLRIHAALLLSVLLLSAHVTAEPSNIQSRLSTLAPARGGSTTAIAVYDLDAGRSIYVRNNLKPLKPASIMKVVTSGAALQELGPDFRFKTEVWETDRLGNRVGALYVKGGGDPSFTTEDLWVLARRIARVGIKEIGALRIDDGFFVGEKEREGQRAYEAGSSAVSLNFNTITIQICPGAIGKPAHLSIDPWEQYDQVGTTPFTGSIKTISSGRSNYRVDEIPCKTPGCLLRFKVSGTFNINQACSEVYRSVSSPGRYFLGTLAGFLKYIGLNVRQVVYSPSTVPPHARPTTTYYSRALSEVIRDMNHYSSNFIAEQLLTAFGYSSKRLDKRERHIGLDKIDRFLAKLGSKSSEYDVRDGSGLSHDNRLTASSVLRVLIWLYENNNFGSEFIASLPVSGRSGTLKHRRTPRSGMVLRAKTGTLTGVSSLAGYTMDYAGRRYAFVIIQNGTRSKPSAEKFEDQVLRVIFGQ